MTSSWFFLSTLNYDARSTTHQKHLIVASCCSSLFIFYYSDIYDTVRQPGQDADKVTNLHCLTAKMIRLNNTDRQTVLLHNSEHDRAEGDPTIHHIIKSRKRQETRTIGKIRDDNHELQETSMTIMKAFTNHFQRAFQPLALQTESMKESLHRITRRFNPVLNDVLLAPTSLEELKTAVSQGKPITPSAWSDGHCPHAARSHSFVSISRQVREQM